MTRHTRLQPPLKLDERPIPANSGGDLDSQSLFSRCVCVCMCVCVVSLGEGRGGTRFWGVYIRIYVRGRCEVIHAFKSSPSWILFLSLSFVCFDSPQKVAKYRSILSRDVLACGKETKKKACHHEEHDYVYDIHSYSASFWLVLNLMG